MNGAPSTKSPTPLQKLYARIVLSGLHQICFKYATLSFAHLQLTFMIMYRTINLLSNESYGRTTFYKHVLRSLSVQ